MTTLIKELREEKGLTQEQLAKGAGVSQQAVQLWESGRSSPTGARLLKVADILGTDTKTIKRGTRAEQQPDMLQFRKRVYAVLRRATPDRVAKEIKIKGIKWCLDYLSDAKAVDVVPGNHPGEIAGALWQLATFKAATGREASLVILTEENSPTSSIVLQRVTVEAALMDISVYTTPTLDDLASLIADIEAI